MERRRLAPERQRWHHARLQHTVTVDDAPLVCVEARTVERMRHLADQPLRAFDRHPRVRIERDHVTDVARQSRRLAVDRDERRVGLAAQQAIELVQLAAFALPAYPASLSSFQMRRRWSSAKRSPPAPTP